MSAGGPGPASIFVDPLSPRSRRPLDAASVLLGTLGLVVAARAAESRMPFETAATTLAAALPSWTSNLFRAVYAAGAMYVAVVIVLALRAPRRHARLLLTVAGGVAAALAAATVASLVVDDRWPELTVDASARNGQSFPTVGVAVLTAVLLTLRPWMVLSFARLDAALAGLLCVAAWAIGPAAPSAVLGALALGVGAAGAALLLLGSPGGHPDLAAAASSLEELGLHISDLHLADVQPWGARLLFGTSEEGHRLVIRVYGRDAVDARRAARWWRTLVYRDQTMPGATRLQLAEHEALLTLLAGRAGVAVPPVIAAAASRGDALVVLRAPPTPFAELGEDALDDDALRRTWCAAARLHEARLCHGELTLDHVGPADDQLVVWGFAHGSMASSRSQIAQETATLLTGQALRVGPERAVAAALATTDRTLLGDARAYLQRPALPYRLRSSAGLKAVLEELQREITERTGASPVAPAPILRVRWRQILVTGFVFLAAYGLVTVLAGLDWAVVLRSWADASWGWVAIGLAIAQLTTVADATTTMSAVTTRLPLFPLVHLQYAVKFVGLAVSATAGRVALSTAFLRRFGEGPAVAVAATALDSLAGAAVNVAVVGLALLLGASADGAISLDSDRLVRVALAVVAAAAVSGAVVVIVPALRRRALTVLGKAWSAFRVVAVSPARILVLLGSNLVSLLITAVSLACMVRAMQPSLPFWTVVGVTAGAGLFASIIPVPGNVGVAEAALTAGLGLAGIPSAPAFAIAVTQRIATSYLPSVIGAYSLRWLRTQQYA